jgi:hypothetical protein
MYVSRVCQLQNIYFLGENLWDNTLRSEKYLTHGLGTLHCECNTISTHKESIYYTYLRNSITPKVMHSWPFQLFFLLYAKMNNTKFVWINVYSVHLTTRMVYSTHHRKVVSSVAQLTQRNSTYHRKRPLPTLCTLVCVQTILISQTLITNIAVKQIIHFTWKWKPLTMYAVMYLQISLSVQRFIMYEAESHENLVSAKKSRPYCVQPYAYQIISIG